MFDQDFINHFKDFYEWEPSEDTLEIVMRENKKTAHQVEGALEDFRKYHTTDKIPGTNDWDRMFRGFCKLQFHWREDNAKPEINVKIPDKEPFKTIATELIRCFGAETYTSWYQYCLWGISDRDIIITAPLGFTAREIINRHGNRLEEFAKAAGYRGYKVRADYSIPFPYRK
jgi:hypothetical protein